MFSKNEMNMWYKKSLNYHFSQDLTEIIISIVNKESKQWINLKETIKKKLKKNIFHNLLYFRKDPTYIHYKNIEDYYYYDVIKNNILKKLICKKNRITLKWTNPIIWWWDETDNIDEYNWINSYI